MGKIRVVEAAAALSAAQSGPRLGEDLTRLAVVILSVGIWVIFAVLVA